MGGVARIVCSLPSLNLSQVAERSLRLLSRQFGGTRGVASGGGGGGGVFDRQSGYSDNKKWLLLTSPLADYLSVR